MVDIYYPDGTPVINPNKKDNQQLSYHIDKKMIKFLDKVKKKITDKDKDYVLIVDGYEGSGKSTFAQQIGKYVDPYLNLDRVCMTASEFKQAINNAGKGQCVIYDEAVTGMSSGDSITRVGKLLKSQMMQMRQKNLFVIVIIPTIFEMGKYAVLSRARCLYHIYENKGKMGYWVGYNKKDLRLLYLSGKKTYSYRIRSSFIGRFYGKYTVNEVEYRRKKSEALDLIDDEEEKEKKKDDLAKISIMLKEKFNIPVEKQPEFLKEYGLSASRSNLFGKRKKFLDKIAKNAGKIKKNDQNPSSIVY
jgi:ABC-type dipeptide/oligopeptide/nickel transport system ATPase component